MRYLSGDHDRFESVCEKQYVVALRILQEDLSSQPLGLVPRLLACVLLISAQLLQRH